VAKVKTDSEHLLRENLIG